MWKLGFVYEAAFVIWGITSMRNLVSPKSESTLRDFPPGRLLSLVSVQTDLSPKKVRIYD